ncbi:MAG TPA: heme exporter protein CcmB [Gammaproteobacteria bacterium]|jgi:heme exporter protein B|nr:heme exporter protein CcmB [Xanthomonadales bacterium]HOP22775.1 heme exporter protein CcmB [Gammaproteobacteria bacterium]HPI95631.1 heme exporter protein CcmB [Gammaproteobacteria bacterium]HPQ87059.1 heme exporter protein CcmB [Gammaproteobacteria bacterium]
MSPFIAIVKRDLISGFRKKSQIYQPLVFQLLVVTMFPLGLGSGAKTLGIISPAVIWILALLASLLTLDQIFKNDYDDGSIESYVLSAYPLQLSVLAKALSHWILSGLPLVIFAPVLGMLLYLPESAYGALVLSLLIGTPIFSLMGSIGSALTMSLKHGGLLLTVLVMPLLSPVLIFGASSVVESSFGNPIAMQLLVLAGMLVLSLTLVPFAAAAAIKINLE